MRALLMLCCLLLAACGQQQAASLPTDDIETAMSWTATAHEVGAAWLAGRVPTAYARMTLHTADQELNKTVQALEPSLGSGADADALRSSLEQVAGSVAPMAGAVEHADRRAMQDAVQRLAAEQQALSERAHRAGVPQ